MRQSAAAKLVNDLSVELKSLATEIDHRIARCTREDTSGSTGPESVSLYNVARGLLAQRRNRVDFFPAELFHEPAWDMLLALYIADEDRQAMSVKTLVATTMAPVTTAQRWIDQLHKLKLIERLTDQMDRRRVEVSLSYTGQRAVVAYLEYVRSS